MALTISALVGQAGLNGIGPLFNSGFCLLSTATGTTGLATLTFASTAFAGASTAAPSLNLSNTITADTSVTAGTILFFSLQTSTAGDRITGSVSTSTTANLQVTNNVVPVGATEVSCPAGITLSLSLSS